MENNGRDLLSAAISLQIYYRFYHGQTKDERFAPVIMAVQLLMAAADRAIKDPVM